MGILKIWNFVKNFGNIKHLISIGVALAICIVGYRYYGKYRALQKDNQALTKSLKTTEAQRQIAVQIANKNADMVKKIKDEHQKDVELLRKSYKYNTDLKRKRDELKRSILNYKDNNLSKDDIDFIKKLYPEVNR